MDCPKCSCEMTDEIRHNVLLVSCGRCGGDFINRETLMTAASDPMEARALERALGEAKARAATTLACPTGDGGQFEVLDIQDVEIDRCRTCLGLFFDRGELRDLVAGKAELPAVEWTESPRLPAGSVVSITFLPEIILGAISRLIV